MSSIHRHEEPTERNTITKIIDKQIKQHVRRYRCDISFPVSSYLLRKDGEAKSSPTIRGRSAVIVISPKYQSQ